MTLRRPVRDHVRVADRAARARPDPDGAAPAAAFRRRAQKYAVRYTGVVDAARRASARRRAWRRHLPAALRPAGDRRARPRARQADPHGRRARRAGVGRARHRPLALDDGDRRRADPPRGRAQRRRCASSRRSRRRVRVGAVAYSDAPDAVQAPDDAPRRRQADRQRPDRRRVDRHRRRARRPRSRASRATARTAGARPRRSCCSPTARRRPAATRCRSPARPGARRSRSSPSRSARRARRSPTPTRTPRRCPVPPDPVTLKRIAQESKGRAYTVEDAGELSSHLPAARVEHRDEDAPAGDHRGVRRRRPAAARGRGRGVDALVGPAAVAAADPVEPAR